MGLAKPNQPISMVMQGGELRVTVTEGLAVTLTGPVEIVGSITINPAWLARHTQ